MPNSDASKQAVVFVVAQLALKIALLTSSVLVSDGEVAADEVESSEGARVRASKRLGAGALTRSRLKTKENARAKF